ncbi:MAG: hypothetical protein ACXWKG_03935 [Limisphaerales bacterium]
MCLFLIASVAHAVDEPKRFTQEKFVIGLWNPPERGDFDKAYKEIADANFTLVVNTPQLKLCEKYGLQALISNGIDESVPDSPACIGYFVADEPGPGSYPEMARRAEEVRMKKPGKFGYINLLPNYAPAWALGGTYDDYVGNFIKIVKPEVLSMDNYPTMRPDGDSRPTYRSNLEVFRKYATAASIPFWNYFYCMPFNEKLDPTEAQIRWQIFTSIAYGAKGVLYFCYWTPGKGAGGGGEFPKGGAIITAEGLKTRHYDEARRINAEVKNLGPTLMKLKSTGVYLVTTTDVTTIPASSGLTNLAGIKGDPVGNYLVGTFTSSDGSRAVMIMNDNYSYTGWLNLTFDMDAKDVMEVSKTTGQLEPVVDDSPELKGLQVSFGAGDGRLFVLPRR